MAASTSRFERWASSYEDNTLQQYLYVPVHQTVRRRHPAVPAELGTALAAHRMDVIGRAHTPWFQLPDVQVIAARCPTDGSATRRPRRG